MPLKEVIFLILHYIYIYIRFWGSQYLKMCKKWKSKNVRSTLVSSIKYYPLPNKCKLKNQFSGMSLILHIVQALEVVKYA